MNLNKIKQIFKKEKTPQYIICTSGGKYGSLVRETDTQYYVKLGGKTVEISKDNGVKVKNFVMVNVEVLVDGVAVTRNVPIVNDVNITDIPRYCLAVVAKQFVNSQVTLNGIVICGESREIG
jgi:uncharacterized protein with ATP-grasp and redox domains